VSNTPLEAAYNPVCAKQLIRTIISDGTVIVTQHAKREMQADNLTIVDCINVLRGGIVDPAEWENGAWRHRIHTAKIYVVVELESEDKLVLITAWRKL